MNYIKKNKRKALIFCITLAVVAAVITTVAVVSTQANTVTIIFGEQTINCKTAYSSPEEILMNEGINPDDYGYVDLSNFKAGQDSVIKLYDTVTVSVYDDGVESVYETQGTVQDLLDENKIDIGESDRIDASPDTKLSPDMTICIEREPNIKIACGDEITRCTTVEGTVADVLAANNISYDEDDIVEPALDTPAEIGMEITVSKLNYMDRTETESIEFKTVTEESFTLGDQETKVQREGENGSAEVVYKDKYVNGELVSSEVIKRTVIKDAVNEVVLVKGTAAPSVKKPRLSEAEVASSHSGMISELKIPDELEFDEDGVPKNYKKCIRGTAKAYTGDTTTATGVTPRPGYIAVDPKQIPYGSKLWVVSGNGQRVYGYAIAADTGGFVKKKSCTVDLFMNSESQCNDWGHRDVRIYVLDI
ncbi:MAG: ubiquitin-like domain-containing protein [Clostridiales bacterium]|nr:ubiquitin-like domain-containing protein [Clostridiales bacterium]